MSAARERRRRYLVDKRFQIRYVLLAVLIFILCIAIGVALTSIGFKSLYGPTEEGGAERVNRVSFLFWIVLLAVLILLVVVGFYGVRMSHRIAGPIYAFSRHLGLVRQGIYYEDVQLRKGDEFRSLANSLNSCLEALREREREAIAKLEDLAQRMENLAQTLPQGSEAAKLKELVGIVHELIEEQRARIQPSE